MSDTENKCQRCNGSGEIGRRGMREAPGPVPGDACGWNAVACPDCRGTGVIVTEDEDEEELMTAAEANTHAEQLRVKALALYAEAKAIKSNAKYGEPWEARFFAKADEAKAADDAYNEAVFRAMRLEAKERRKSRAA